MWLWVSSWAVAADGLPVERVRIYETGVAWFERAGTVRGSTSLDLPRSHLDDALKSLVVLGGQASVRAITFPAAVSDRAVRTLAGLPESDSAGFGDGLKALLGAPVAVRLVQGDRHQGTLLSVDAISAVGGERGPRTLDVPTWALGLLTPDGGLVRVLTSDVAEVRSLAPDQQWRLDEAGRSFAASRAQQPHQLRVDVARGGSLAIGYLAEAPVWRTTYRIVAADDGAALLQAWALVHNDTDEDWSDVTIEVANGQPRSFLYPLAAPRYPRRSMETPDVALSTVPQLAAATPDSLWDGDHDLVSSGLGASGVGYGAGGGSVSGQGLGRLSSAPAELREAEPVDTPTQFVVRVAEPVDLPAHHSALLPLGMDDLTTEGAVAFAPGSQQPRTAVWMVNTTGRTLPTGVVTVLAGGGFSGETRFARTKPDERQLLLVGEELDVDLERTTSSEPERDEAVRWRANRWTITRSRSEATTLSLRNRSGRPRAVWVAFTLGPQSQVLGDRRTEIDPQRGWTWVVVDIPPGPSTHRIGLARTTIEHRSAAMVSAERYRDWADRGLADASSMRRAAGLAARLAELSEEQRDVTSEAERLDASLERLRQDLEAAEGGATRSLGRRIAALEQDRHRTDERLAELETQRASIVDELDAHLGPLANRGPE